MLIGILSDTHGLLRQEVIDAFKHASPAGSKMAAQVIFDTLREKMHEKSV